MLHRKGLVRAAAFAALACTGICRAETTGSPSDDGLTLRPAFLDAPATAPAPPPATTTAPATIPNPLMLLLEHTPFGAPLENAGFTLSGFVEGGYTASFQHPAATDANIAGRFQDNKSEHIVLDQIDFMIDRPVDQTKWDIGGHFEFIYGRDTAFFHSTGIYDNPFVFGAQGAPYYKSTTAPENQVDIDQAYMEFGIPIGTGLRVQAGKFVTLLGYETINPTTNNFYSHSYLFTFAIPLTQTGVLFDYKPTGGALEFNAGFTRGWSQSLYDNNGGPDFLGEVTYTPQGSDFQKKFKFVANLSEGPQATHDNSDWWTVVDLQAIYTDGPWVAALNGDYGDAPNAFTGSSAQWGGLAGYLSYTPANQSFVTLNTRAEWYQDAQGYTLAGFVGGPAAGGVENLYEATVGATITVFPDDPVMKNLVIRPELRFDYASKDFFNDATKHFQSTFGIDVFFKY